MWFLVRFVGFVSSIDRRRCLRRLSRRSLMAKQISPVRQTRLRCWNSETKIELPKLKVETAVQFPSNSGRQKAIDLIHNLEQVRRKIGNLMQRHDTLYLAFNFAGNFFLCLLCFESFGFYFRLRATVCCLNDGLRNHRLELGSDTGSTYEVALNDNSYVNVLCGMAFPSQCSTFNITLHKMCP